MNHTNYTSDALLEFDGEDYTFSTGYLRSMSPGTKLEIDGSYMITKLTNVLQDYSEAGIKLVLDHKPTPLHQRFFLSSHKRMAETRSDKRNDSRIDIGYEISKAVRITEIGLGSHFTKNRSDHLAYRYNRLRLSLFFRLKL